MMGARSFSVGLRDDRTLEMRPERLPATDNGFTFTVAMECLEVAVYFASVGSCWVSAQHVLLFDSAFSIQREGYQQHGEGVS